jgi:hypothetical protein
LKKQLILIYLIPCFVFLVTWTALKYFHGPLAGWCTVTYPAEVTVDQDITVKVHYSGIQDETYLVVDLHWNKRSMEWVGYLSSAGESPRIKGEGSHEFSLEVTDREDIGFISVVIYLSPTGQWKDVKKAAHTGLIPVVRSGELSKRHREKTVSPAVIANGALSGVDMVSDRKEPHRLISAFYAAALLLTVGCVFRSLRFSSTGSRDIVLRWSITAALIIIGFVWEQLFLTGFAGVAREQSRILGWYERRQLFQRLAVVGSVSVWSAISVLITVKGYRSRDISRIALILAVSLCCIIFVRSISYHFIDTLSRVGIFGVGLLTVVETVFVTSICISEVCFLAKRRKVSNVPDTDGLP